MFCCKIMNDLGWETLQNRRKKHRLVTFYKMTNGLTPQYLTILVPQRVNEVAGRRLRNDDNFVTPRPKTNLYQNSFLSKTVRNWNNLPIEITSASSLNSFKTLINRNLTKPPKYYYEGDRQAKYCILVCDLAVVPSTMIYSKEKGRDLTQSYDKSPYTDRKIQKATWQHRNGT